MNETLRATLAGRDPSLPLALAALLGRCGPEGSAAFGDLAVQYREDYLALRQSAFGESRAEGGVLSVDQVRRHLAESVLPRLVTDHLLAAFPQPPDDGTPVGFHLAVWPSLAGERAP